MGVSVISRPDITVETISSTDHISRWLAVNADYPVIFHLRRQDYNVSSVIENAGKVALVISGVDVTAAFEVADTIYFSASVVESQTTTVTNSQAVSSDTLITTNVDWPVGGASDVGSYWVNLLSKRADYSVQISLVDAATNLILEQIDYQPFKSGDMKIDIGAWIKAYLSTVLDTTYPTTSRADENSAKSFYLKWLPTYTGSAETETTDSFFYYGVNAANQLQNENGVNFADYVGFDADLSEGNKAKFLTVFDEPVYWPGYPFKIGYIVEREAGNPEVTRKENHYETDGTLTGTDSTLLPTDYEKVNHVALSGGYAANEEVINLWLESTFPPTSACGLLNANDYSYSAWLLRLDETLDSIFVDLNNPTTQIASIDSYPSGILYNNSDVAMDTVSWSGIAYVPDLDPTGIIISGTWRVSIPNIPVTTKTGESCTLTFDQEFTNALSNQFPIASSVGLSAPGSFSVGETLTVGYTYSDSDGDIEDNTETENGIVWKRFDAPTGISGETTIQTGGTTYVVQAADEGKYIVGIVTPYALTGNSPGNSISSPRSQILEVGFSLSTTKQTGFEISQQGGAGTIYWGDGDSDVFDATSGLISTSHTYASPGTYTVTVFCNPNNVVGITAINQSLQSLDISRQDNITYLNVSNNSGLTTLSLPVNHVATFTYFDLVTTGISGGFDYSGINIGGTFRVANVPITGLTHPSSTSALIQYSINNNSSLAGAVNLSTIDLGGVVQLYLNPSVTSYVFGSNTSNITSLSIYNSGCVGAIDISMLNVASVVQIRSMSGVTAIILPSSSGTISSLLLYSNGITGYVDMTGLTFSASPSIQLQSNAITDAGDLNHILFDLDAKLGAGAGLVNVSGGTNATPDGTSGGYDGITAKANIIANGHTAITN